MSSLVINISLINKGLLYVCMEIGYVVFMHNRRGVTGDLLFHHF